MSINDEHPDESTGLSRSQARLLETCAQTVATLPDRFHCSGALDAYTDLPYVDLDAGLKDQLRRRGILICVSQRRVRGGPINLYEASAAAQTRAEKMLETRPETAVPGCPHTGLRNLGGDQYSCTEDGCNNSCSRDEVRL